MHPFPSRIVTRRPAADALKMVPAVVARPPYFQIRFLRRSQPECSRGYRSSRENSTAPSAPAPAPVRRSAPPRGPRLRCDSICRRSTALSASGFAANVIAKQQWRLVQADDRMSTSPSLSKSPKAQPRPMRGAQRRDRPPPSVLQTCRPGCGRCSTACGGESADLLFHLRINASRVTEDVRQPSLSRSSMPQPQVYVSGLHPETPPERDVLETSLASLRYSAGVSSAKWVLNEIPVSVEIVVAATRPCRPVPGRLRSGQRPSRRPSRQTCRPVC